MESENGKLKISFVATAVRKRKVFNFPQFILHKTYIPCVIDYSLSHLSPQLALRYRCPSYAVLRDAPP